MKNQHIRRTVRGFTLIELLVVIAIIAILAALVVGLAGVATKKNKLGRAGAQLAKLETHIDIYKTKKGFFPPDNQITSTDPRKWGTNQLFYELSGTILTNNNFQTINGGYSIGRTDVQNYFGAGGFVNSSQAAKGQDGFDAQQFMQGVDDVEISNIGTTNAPVYIFSAPIQGPHDITLANGRTVNMWNYISSNPTNNPNSYDLWIDLLIGGKTNRISNWSKTPQIVN